MTDDTLSPTPEEQAAMIAVCHPDFCMHCTLMSYFNAHLLTNDIDKVQEFFIYAGQGIGEALASFGDPDTREVLLNVFQSRLEKALVEQTTQNSLEATQSGLPN